MVTQLGVAKYLEFRQVMTHKTVGKGTAPKKTVVKPHHSESFENSEVKKSYIPLIFLAMELLQMALLFCWVFCSHFK